MGTSVTTDESGRAVYRQALPGAYEILFRAKGVGSAMYQGAKLSEGMNELRVELR
ncbi:MAG: peptidase associated/transthyretin-like domain-containing protein [Planctomycetota bacterium]